MKRIILILFIASSIVGCDSDKNSKPSEKVESIKNIYNNSRNYTILLKSALNEFNLKGKISKDLIIDLIPEDSKEFSKYYDLSYKDKGGVETRMYDYLEDEIYYIGIVKENNKEIIKKIILIAPYVDGEYAESYFDYLSYITENHTGLFCEVYSRNKDKLNRLKGISNKFCK